MSSLATTRKAESLVALRDRIVACAKCPRLVLWRTKIARQKVARYRDWSYWGKPVPGFGDPHARLVIIGLAPAAHGGNRTGRMFTGDRSGEWLYRALHAFGFANRPASLSRDDGLRLRDCYITASVRCAPPDNKPSRSEFRNCRPYLLEELQLIPDISVVVALGRIAYDAAFDAFAELGLNQATRKPRFRHGVRVGLNGHLTLIGSYHPSQRNTFTGTLTESMFNSIFRAVRVLLPRQSALRSMAGR